MRGVVVDPLGPGSMFASTARVGLGRLTVARLFAVGMAALLLCTAAACGGSGTGPSTPLSSGAVSALTGSVAPNALSIPTGNLDAYARCMVKAGWQLAAVHTDQPGLPPGYDFSIPGKLDQASYELLRQRSKQCDALRPAVPTMSDDEIRQVYDRWVGEYQCMVGLGYQPDPPPSVETFVASWKTGPWMPINGLDTIHWKQADYDLAKAKCTLEFFTDDRFSK
jgi:hypothetical protein